LRGKQLTAKRYSRQTGRMDRPAPGHEELGAWINLVQARDIVAVALERRLQAGAGVSLAEHEVLVRLATAPGKRLRMLDLATLLLVSKSGITRLVDRLTREGWVRRELSDLDRRFVYAALTERGHAKVRASVPVFAEAVRDVFLRHVSEQDVADLRRILRKLLEGHGLWSDARCSPAIGTPQPDSASRIV
jgi:DNA-binding MarR family transcriptional regulator